MDQAAEDVRADGEVGERSGHGHASATVEAGQPDECEQAQQEDVEPVAAEPDAAQIACERVGVADAGHGPGKDRADDHQRNAGDEQQASPRADDREHLVAIALIEPAQEDEREDGNDDDEESQAAHARTVTSSPNRPVGLKTSTMMRTTNAQRSL